MSKKVWKDVFAGTNPSTGRPYFRRVQVTVLGKDETPPPPENFEEGDIPSEKKSTHSGGQREEFVPPTFVGKLSERLDKKWDNATSRGSLLESEGKEGE